MSGSTAMTFRLAHRARNLVASEIRELLKLIGRPGVISFAGGLPDPSLFPREELRAVYEHVLGDAKAASLGLQYTVTEGYGPLREWIANYLRADGIVCDAENVLIISGSQQGIDFMAKLFLDPGDRVLVQSESFLGALQAFRSYECEFDILPATRPADPSASGRTAGSSAKLVYATADFRNPTGENLSLVERHEIVRLARAHDAVLLEDHAYRHLNYEGPLLPSLVSLDLEGRHLDEGRSVYLGTFSKSIVPGLRIGWIAAPRSLIEKLVFLKQASDVQVSTINQMVMTEVVKSCFDRLGEVYRAEYRRRRDCMLAALEQHFPSQVRWTRPEGGFFVWATLPPWMDAAAVLQRSLDEAQVAFVPGNPFCADGRGRHTLRLAFSLVEPPVIEAGVRKLGALLHELLQVSPPPARGSP